MFVLAALEVQVHVSNPNTWIVSKFMEQTVHDDCRKYCLPSARNAWAEQRSLALCQPFLLFGRLK